MTNIADPDQTAPAKEQSDWDLHCLPRNPFVPKFRGVTAGACRCEIGCIQVLINLTSSLCAPLCKSG